MEIAPTEIVTTEVLIIGSGLAGLTAALAAVDLGALVTVVSKGEIGRSGNSSRASGGFAAAVDDADCWQKHLQDFLAGGCGINQTNLTQLVASQAPNLLNHLAINANGFAIENSKLIGSPVPGHNYPRSVQFQRGMSNLLDQLVSQLRDRRVELWSNLQCVELIKNQHNEICGGYFYDVCRDSILACVAGSVVLAAGGCGQLFPVTSNALEMTGDSYAIALSAGCALLDMEFIQFTPTAFAAPQKIRGQTIVGSLLALPGVRLLNNQGERFMTRYHPSRMETADRATLARAIAREIREGRGTESGGVYLDLRQVESCEYEQHRPGFYQYCLDAGIDSRRSMLETAPSAHTCLGGIVVDQVLSALPGLFVCGESLGGTHGANRLSSNSLIEALVTGNIAGVHSASHTNQIEKPASFLPLIQPAIGGLDLAELKQMLIYLVGTCAGVQRNGEQLENGRSEISKLSGELAVAANYGVVSPEAWYDLHNMCIVARAILTAALARKESRGAHFRTDYPLQDDVNYFGSFIVKGGADMRTNFRSLTNNDSDEN